MTYINVATDLKPYIGAGVGFARALRRHAPGTG